MEKEIGRLTLLFGLLILCRYSSMAEHLFCNQDVASSNLITGSDILS